MVSILDKSLFLLILTFLISGCSNPLQVNDNPVDKNQLISQDSINPKLAEITVWQYFIDPCDPANLVYRAIQRNEGNFSTCDSITLEAKDTLYSVGFEIEWNTSKHTYSLNKLNYRGSGWTTLDLQCSRKYTLIRVN